MHPRADEILKALDRMRTHRASFDYGCCAALPQDLAEELQRLICRDIPCAVKAEHGQLYHDAYWLGPAPGEDIEIAKARRILALEAFAVEDRLIFDHLHTFVREHNTCIMSI